MEKNKQNKQKTKNEYQKQSPEVFYVLKNLAKFTERHLCQSLFFNKVASCACNFIKKEILTWVFSCELCKISKSTFFIEHLQTTASRICMVTSAYSS